MIVRLILIFCAALFSCLHGHTQDFIRNLTISVSDDNGELGNPWGGGMCYTQYSTIDLNGDGIEDLFVFDRAGNKVLTFIKSTNDQSLDYIYSPEYESLFPSDLDKWALLRDYNCDGLKDIFTASSVGIKVYKQSFNGSVNFEEVFSPLVSFYGFENEFEAPLYNSSLDLPIIKDIDYDGDLDILSFTSSGDRINFFINNASDFDRCDTLIMELGNACYGFVQEIETTSEIALGSDCDYNVLNVRSLQDAENKALVHMGGSLSAFDMNGDGHDEILIGDNSEASLPMLINSHNEQQLDSITEVQNLFPANISMEEPIDIFQSPGVYFEDFNGDGLTDFAAGSFSSGSQHDVNSWLYLNNGTSSSADFELISKRWLQGEMIKNGTHSYPVLLDFNHDNLMDLVVSNKHSTIEQDLTYSSFILYENTGTITQPVFQLVENDWLNFSESGLFDIYPTFGDVDGDSDLDLIIGASSGQLYLYSNDNNSFDENITFSEPTSLLDENNDVIDVGQNAKPQLVDLDEDGLYDLVIGKLSGRVSYYQNVGTASSSIFSEMSEDFGNIEIDDWEFGTSSVPWFYKDHNNEWAAVVGSRNGHVQRYTNISTVAGAEFSRVDQELFDQNIGTYSSPSLADINGDNYPDLFLGNIRGGLGLFLGQFYDGIPEQVSAPDLTVYPNPNAGQFTLTIPQGTSTETIYLTDVNGRTVKTVAVNGAWQYEISTSELEAGIYIVNVSTADGNLISKVVKE